MKNKTIYKKIKYSNKKLKKTLSTLYKLNRVNDSLQS
jgi:hypothetical protein